MLPVSCSVNYGYIQNYERRNYTNFPWQTQLTRANNISLGGEDGNAYIDTPHMQLQFLWLALRISMLSWQWEQKNVQQWLCNQLHKTVSEFLTTSRN